MVLEDFFFYFALPSSFTKGDFNNILNVYMCDYVYKKKCVKKYQTPTSVFIFNMVY